MAQLTGDNQALPTIPIEHFEIHEGEYCSLTRVTTNVSNNASIDTVLIPQSTTKDAHVRFGAVGGGQLYCYLYEVSAATNLTASTNAVSFVNNNRAKSDLVTLKAYDSGTLTTSTSDYSVLFTFVVPGGASANTRVGNARDTGEFILNKDKRYLYRVTNSSGSTVPVMSSIECYEHES